MNITGAKGDTLPLSSRWIHEFEKQLLRRKHILLYGNIYDQFLSNDIYQSVHQFLDDNLRDRGFRLIIRFDLVDGFTFVEDSQQLCEPQKEPLEPIPTDKRTLFVELKKRGMAARTSGLPNDDTMELSTISHRGNLLQAPPRSVPGASSGWQVGQRVSPEDAFGDLRVILGQEQIPVAAIVDLADMLTTDPNHYPVDERNALVLLKKCTLEAAVIQEGPLAGYQNILIILANDLKRVPEWFYRDNPFVTLVQAERPNKEERQQFAMHFVCPSGSWLGFYGGQNISAQRTAPDQPSELEQLAEEFADLTEGLQAIDLEALRMTSHTARIPVRVKDVRRLVDFFKFGVREDPWEKLNPERIRHAREELSKVVIGQSHAVDAVVTMLTSARVGLNLSDSNRGGSPKGVFFFVGPTGVGKTELAKAVTKLVFGDERAFARFDMSEYKEEHAAEKLAGAPPGFVGYDAGGQLTNRVMEQPYSILLFDEIEKAHPKVLDKFLQILEDGRLTDGKGQTAYFNQTAIIFTSNIGASDLTDLEGNVIRQGIMLRVTKEGYDAFSPDKVAQHFRDEVKWYFTSKIGRAELLNRLGDNIVVFDLLRPDYVQAIGEKFTTMFASTAMEKYNVALQFNPSWFAFLQSEMSRGDNMLLGGRRIKTLTLTHLVNGVNEWIFSNIPATQQLSGRTLEVGVSAQRGVEVVDV